MLLYWNLSSLGVIESPISCVPIVTQTFDRIRLCFRMKVRFSDAFLASHRINQRQRMQKDTCCSWDVRCGIQVLTSASHVVLRAFVLTYAIHFWVYLSQSEVERTDLASQNHNFVQFAINSTEKRLHKSNSTWFGIQSARTNESLKIADLQLISVSRVPICKQTNRAGFKTWPPAFGLGRVKTNRLEFKTWPPP